jgi:hypothetical protein
MIINEKVRICFFESYLTEKKRVYSFLFVRYLNRGLYTIKMVNDNQSDVLPKRCMYTDGDCNNERKSALLYIENKIVSDKKSEFCLIELSNNSYLSFFSFNIDFFSYFLDILIVVFFFRSVFHLFCPCSHTLFICFVNASHQSHRNKSH